VFFRRGCLRQYTLNMGFCLLVSCVSISVPCDFNGVLFLMVIFTGVTQYGGSVSVGGWSSGKY
jgi:hypothetical protein